MRAEYKVTLEDVKPNFKGPMFRGRKIADQIERLLIKQFGRLAVNREPVQVGDGIGRRIWVK